PNATVPGASLDYAWDEVGTYTDIIDNYDYPTLEIRVADVTKFKTGDSIQIYVKYLDDPNRNFVKIHDMTDIWDSAVKLNTPDAFIFRRTVMNIKPDDPTFVNTKGVLVLDVPTRYRIKMIEKPRVVKGASMISEVGLENFSIG